MQFAVAKNKQVLHLATAANFAPALKVIIKDFESKYPNAKVIMTMASSGKIYSQIMQGAPFDIFFSADIQRPKLLEKSGKILPGSRKTYAIGQLLLWSRNPDLLKNVSDWQLIKFRKMAIANPKLAPYGAAAMQTIAKKSLLSQWESKLVLGENISQAFHFVETGNADVGFISRSQYVDLPDSRKGSTVEIPQNLYDPIEQQFVVMQDKVVIKDFLNHMQTDQIKKIILKFGFQLP